MNKQLLLQGSSQLVGSQDRCPHAQQVPAHPCSPPLHVQLFSPTANSTDDQWCPGSPGTHLTASIDALAMPRPKLPPVPCTSLPPQVAGRICFLRWIERLLPGHPIPLPGLSFPSSFQGLIPKICPSAHNVHNNPAPLTDTVTDTKSGSGRTEP